MLARPIHFHLLCICILFVALFGTSLTTHAAYDPASGYYAATPALAGGAPLKASLHQIVRSHTKLSYTPGVWNALRNLDQDPSNSNNVILLYNGASRPKSLQDPGNENDNYWNREHVWPLSLGPGTTSTDAGTDLHHLFASDKNVNARRGNLPFDEIISGGTTDPEAPLSRYNSSAYEPRDADKGRIARALFYMAVRYEPNDDVAAVGDLELQPTTAVSGNNMGNRSTLLAWHRAFPPTEAERIRNHKVDTLYQGNRNPFIDNPLFADRVFSGDTPFEAWRRPHFTQAQLGLAAVSGDTADPDGDGLANLLEFAFNLVPRAADAGTATTLTLLAPTSPGGSSRLSVAHRRHRYATDVMVRYEISPDLASWTEATPTTINTLYLDAQTDRVTIEVPMAGASRFLRVRATRSVP